MAQAAPGLGRCRTGGVRASEPGRSRAGTLSRWRRRSASSWPRTTCSCGKGFAPSSPRNPAWRWLRCTRLEELLEAVAASAPDLVVTDIRMPPTHTDEGIRAAQMLRRSHPSIAVLVLSHFVEASYALALLEDGSSGRGYLLKDRVTQPERLKAALDAVAAGGSYIDDSVVDALVSARRRADSSPFDRLSQREAEVLAEIARGRSNTAIAATFGISTRAVEKHVSSIFTKLDLLDDAGTNRRVQAALRALRAGGQL